MCKDWKFFFKDWKFFFKDWKFFKKELSIEIETENFRIDSIGWKQEVRALVRVLVNPE
jgi:hypothetical protein